MENIICVETITLNNEILKISTIDDLLKKINHILSQKSECIDGDIKIGLEIFLNNITFMDPYAIICLCLITKWLRNKVEFIEMPELTLFEKASLDLESGTGIYDVIQYDFMRIPKYGPKGKLFAINDFISKLGSQVTRQIIEDKPQGQISVIYYLIPAIVLIALIFIIIKIKKK